MIVSYIADMTQNSFPSPTHRQRGRPREFDVDQAIDKAIGVFAERGFHATSVGDLTDAMELTQGSLYKAFKDKKDVYVAALERYKLVQSQRFMAEVDKGRTGRDRVWAAFDFYASRASGPSGHQGCLLVGAVADLASLDEDVAAVVRSAVAARETILARLIREGQTDGSITGKVDATVLAKTALCLLYGMRVVGKTGPARTEWAPVVDAAMRLFD